VILGHITRHRHAIPIWIFRPSTHVEAGNRTVFDAGGATIRFDNQFVDGRIMSKINALFLPFIIRQIWDTRLWSRVAGD